MYIKDSTRYLQLNRIKLINITKLQSLYYIALSSLSPHAAGLLCLSGLYTSQRFQHRSESCRGSRWHRQRGKPACMRKNCHRLPAAERTPSLLSCLTLPRKDGGNEQTQCHPGNERPQGPSGNERPPCLAGNERLGSPDKKS